MDVEEVVAAPDETVVMVLMTPPLFPFGVDAAADVQRWPPPPPAVQLALPPALFVAEEVGAAAAAAAVA